jgi:phage terminase Nu1 subunit (DNA packaging protein)|tara:strand:- start:1082 stop:1657 length:576 start_codon:yes stop_codon:yes gene_type:complete
VVVTVPTISVANIARLVGLNVEALKKLRTRKIVTAPLRKTEWPATVVTEYCDYLRSRISGDSEEDAHAQRTRLLKQQADKLEMENESSRGRLVTLGEMQGVWEKMISAAKSRLLYAPVKLAPVVAVEDSAAICKDLIAEQINEALDELSRKLGEWSADSGPPDVGGEGVEATAETDDQPVVGPDEETVPGS